MALAPRLALAEKALKEIATASDEVIADDLRTHAKRALEGWDV